MTKPKTDDERATEQQRNKELRTKFPKLYAALHRKQPPKPRAAKPTPRSDGGTCRRPRERRQPGNDAGTENRECRSKE